MLTGIALALSELPAELMDKGRLSRRVHQRGGEGEVRFLFRHKERLLPVWREGELELVRWGTRRGEAQELPCTGWAQLVTAEAGGWSGAEEVVIPATLGFDGGVWYKISQGIRGLLIRDDGGTVRVYVLVEPSSHYYRVMTRSDWMPCLIGERI